MFPINSVLAETGERYNCRCSNCALSTYRGVNYCGEQWYLAFEPRVNLHQSPHTCFIELCSLFTNVHQVPLSSLASDLITVLVLWFSQLQSLYLTLILFLQPICILFPILPSQRLIFWPWLLCWRQVKSIISHREAKLSSASVW